MQEVVSAYKDPGSDGVKQVQSTGLHIAGEKFVVLKADERSIYGKKVSGRPKEEERATVRWTKEEGNQSGGGIREGLVDLFGGGVSRVVPVDRRMDVQMDGGKSSDC